MFFKENIKTIWYLCFGRKHRMVHRVLLPIARYSKKAHKDQFRDDNITPYFTHPKSVVRILWDHGVRDVTVLSAAYCHDIWEDTKEDPEQLRKLTNLAVMDMLFWLTNTVNGDFWTRQEGLLDHAKKMNHGARLVKLADRLHNLESLGQWEKYRQIRYAQASLELLGALYPWPNREMALKIRKEALAILSS